MVGLGKFRRKLSLNEGAELLEAALALPILLLVMLAVVNLGMVVFASQMAEEAARYGVRAGAVAESNQAAAAASAALSFATTTFPIGAPSVTVLSPGGAIGSTLRIRVTYRVPNYLRGFAALFPGIPSREFVVSGEAAMRQEGWLR